MKFKQHLPYLFWGLGFGFIISRAGAVRFDFINSMFLLTDLRLYGVIGGAIAVAMPLFALMKRYQKQKHKAFKNIKFPHRRMTPGTLPGAAIFGLGWAITGTCPGPAVVQLGEGHLIALATLAGIVVGNWAYGQLHLKYFKWQSDFCS